MASYSLGTIAEKVQGELWGDPEMKAHRVRAVEEAVEGDVCVVMDRRAASLLRNTHASALIVPLETESFRKDIIRVRNPRHALIDLLELFHPSRKREGGVDPGADFARSGVGS